jgi:hypothetical protein
MAFNGLWTKLFAANVSVDAKHLTRISGLNHLLRRGSLLHH